MIDRRYKKNGNYEKLTKQGVKQLLKNKTIVKITSDRKLAGDNDKKYKMWLLNTDINLKVQRKHLPNYLSNYSFWWYNKKSNILKWYSETSGTSYYKIINE